MFVMATSQKDRHRMTLIPLIYIIESIAIIYSSTIPPRLVSSCFKDSFLQSFFQMVACCVLRLPHAGSEAISKLMWWVNLDQPAPQVVFSSEAEVPNFFGEVPSILDILVGSSRLLGGSGSGWWLRYFVALPRCKVKRLDYISEVGLGRKLGRHGGNAPWEDSLEMGFRVMENHGKTRVDFP